MGSMSGLASSSNCFSCTRSGLSFAGIFDPPGNGHYLSARGGTPLRAKTRGEEDGALWQGEHYRISISHSMLSGAQSRRKARRKTRRKESLSEAFSLCGGYPSRAQGRKPRPTKITNMFPRPPMKADISTLHKPDILTLQRQR